MRARRTSSSWLDVARRRGGLARKVIRWSSLGLARPLWSGDGRSFGHGAQDRPSDRDGRLSYRTVVGPLVGLFPRALGRAARRLGRLVFRRPRPSPQRTAQQFALLRRAVERIAVGDPSAAVRDADAVLAVRPLDTGALKLRATALETPRIRGRSSAPAELVADGEAAVSLLHALGHDHPVILAYYPSKTVNPFLALLYSRAIAHGVAALPLAAVTDADALLPLTRSGARVVLHLHWTNWLLRGVQSTEEADARIADLLDRLDGFIGGGGRLVWTVHDVFPHDAVLVAKEARLRQAIIDRSAVVHVMSPATADAVAHRFTIPPERVLHVPHPAYDGAYEDYVDRATARFALGLDPDDIVHLVIGALKPYKGLLGLLDAFAAMPDGDAAHRRLLVAGKPDGSPLTS